MQKFSSKDFKVLPWKNGGGKTLELYRAADPYNANEFLLRFSIAQVEIDGPFSVFEGIDRSLLLLTGHGMRLNFSSGQIHNLVKNFDQINFHGESIINCNLIKGPTEDFNVMIKRSWGKAIASHKTSIEKEYTRHTFIYTVQSHNLYEFKNEVIGLDSESDTDFIVIGISNDISTN